jgi:hypothetical protein
MGTKYLTDSNVVIDYLSGTLPPEGMMFLDKVMDETPKVSVITQIEVLGYNAPFEAYRLLMEFMEDAEILELSAKVVQQTIDLRKSCKIKLPDAVIAATALVHELTLISRNKGDFKNVAKLQVIDPHTV